MQKISRKTLEIILKSFEASSKDITRVNLNTVRLFKLNDKIAIESCDGYILSRHFVEENGDEFDIDQDVLISKDGASYLKAFLKTNKSDRFFSIDTDVLKNNTLAIFTEDNKSCVGLPVVFRDYPATSDLIPKTNKDDYLEINFNPELLARLYKALGGDEKKRHPKVKLLIRKHNSNTSPIVVKTGENSEGVLMPIRS